MDTYYTHRQPSETRGPDFKQQPYCAVSTRSFDDLRNQLTIPTCIPPFWLHDLSVTMGVFRSGSLQACDVDADTGEIFSMRLSSLEDLAPCDPETLELNSSHFSRSLDEKNLILGLDIPAVKSGHHEEADANLQSLTSKDTLQGTRKRSNSEESQEAADWKRPRLDSTYSGENGVKMPFNSNYRSGQNGRAGCVVSLSPSQRDADQRRREGREDLRAGDATVVISEIRRVGPLSLMNDGNKLSSKI